LPVSFAKSLSTLFLSAAAVCTAAAQQRAPAAPRAPAAAPAPAPLPARRLFTFDTVLADAKRRAALPFVAQTAPLPAWLDKLGAEQYRSIRFDPDADIWRSEKLPFRMELLPAGFNFHTTVKVSIVDAGRVQDVAATPAMFHYGRSVPPPASDLPLSGFRIRGHINSNKIWDEFLVFQGASYFRAVARHQVYGMSGRGLALNTAEPAGEEFPAFTHFWIEQPARKAAAIVVYALLESRSTTGAYRFVVTPGRETSMDVDLTLFPRAELRIYGIAPLTSMFLFDQTNRGRLDDYRPEVHDSDGLQITTKSGEHIWRQLANPAKLQVSTFTSEAPRGFGLMQRSRRESDFDDLGAQYERRPSVWVEPRSDFGPGAVELVEIPSGRETNDNIVAFFRPARALPAGSSAHFAYRLTWLAQTPAPKGLGEVKAARSGASLDGKRRVFQVDFVGAGDKTAGLQVDLSASAGRTSRVVLSPDPAIHGMRAGFELDPKGADLIELRLQVARAGRPVTETWLYRWTAS